jgi:hypothetical protein
MCMAKSTAKQDELKRQAALALKARDRLWWFSRARWGHTSSDPFLTLRHQQMLAEFLEAFYRREIQHILIAMPPGIGKSITFSCDFPAWALQKNPSLKFLCVSYGDDLIKNFHRECRDIIRTRWYESAFPHVQIRRDVDNYHEFATTKGGYRKATTVGGKVTGLHPNFTLIDDPLKLAESGSDIKKRHVNDWFDRELSSRGWTKDVGIGVNAQRFADDDLFNHLAERKGFVKCVLPMEYKPNLIMENPLGLVDWRTEPGERLCPESFVSDDALAEQRLKGAHFYAAQFQQTPTAESGDLIDRNWFKVVTPTKIEMELLQAKGRAVRFWDKASTSARRADFSAGILLIELDGTYWVMDLHRGKWDSFKRNDEIRKTAEIDAARFSNYIVAMEQEAAGGGAESAQVSVQELEGFRVRVRRPRMGKPRKDEYDLKRWESWAVALGRGDVVVCKADWNNAMIEEHCLVGEMLVVTKRGEIPIKDVTEDDYVITRKGWRRVLKSWCTNRSAEVCEIKLDDGSEILTTLNHPIYRQGSGFVKAEHLRVGDVLLRYTGVSHSTTTRKERKNAQTQGILQQPSMKNRFSCIGMCGSAKLVRYLKGSISTTLTAITGTMRSPIWNVLPRASITRSIHQRICNISKSMKKYVKHAETNITQHIPTKADRVLQNADIHCTDLRGDTKITLCCASRAAILPMSKIQTPFFAVQSVPKKGRNDPVHHVCQKRNASGVENCFNPKIARGDFAADRVVVQITMHDKRRSVYNLKVQETPEFVANGTLVHNCNIPNGRYDDIVDACSGAYTELAVYSKKNQLRRPLLMSATKKQEEPRPISGLEDALSVSQDSGGDWVSRHW